MNDYLKFTLDYHASAGRKTDVWLVLAISDGFLLGTIKWFARWRQYAFFPEPGTVWNPDCLAAVNGQVRWLMNVRLLDRRRARSMNRKEHTR